MQEKFDKNLEKAKKIISDFDNFKIEGVKANSKFLEGNKLLDDCLDIINKKKLLIEEISLVDGKIIPKKRE